MLEVNISFIGNLLVFCVFRSLSSTVSSDFKTFTGLLSTKPHA